MTTFDTISEVEFHVIPVNGNVITHGECRWVRRYTGKMFIESNHPLQRIRVILNKIKAEVLLTLQRRYHFPVALKRQRLCRALTDGFRDVS